MLRVGTLRTVYHGAPSVLTLKELVRNYNSLVEDATRVMLRIKALFRARAIRTPGRSVYSASRRKEWLDQLTTPGARVRAASLLVQLDLLLELRPKAKTAMIAEARKQPGWKPLRSIRSSASCAWRNSWRSWPHRIDSARNATSGRMPALPWSPARAPITSSQTAGFAGGTERHARAA